MDRHDATEIAFKNGYQKAVSEIFEEIYKILDDSRIDRYLEKRGFCYIGKNEKTLEQRIAELKKKYTEDSDES